MTVVPRWEWRTFAGDRAALAAAFAGRAPERVEEGDEIYLLSLQSDASAKIRRGRLDVKRLIDARADGLELWTPVLKAGFPIAAPDVRFALSALGTVPPDTVRMAYTRRQLLTELVAARSGLRAVEVHKRRERYRAGGCLAELTTMETAAGATASVAVEAEDADRVIAEVERLGLALRPVACVARGLKSLVRFGAPRFAVIDVGTNSVKLHVAERLADGGWRTIADCAEVTRLGEGVDGDGRLQPEPMRRTTVAIAGMALDARRNRAEAIAAVGTAGLRAATNAADFVAAVRARCGIAVEVISGEDEARLAYAAAVRGVGPVDGSAAVFDTGGGSSQFTFGEAGRVEERFSVPVGAVATTERFGLDAAVPETILDDARSAIAARLERVAGRPAPRIIVGMGGAVTNLAAVRHRMSDYDANVVHGTVLDRAELARQIDLFRSLGADEREAVAGVQPGRAPVILAGALIVDTALALLGGRTLTVSDRGLRHGVLEERFHARGAVSCTRPGARRG